MATALGLAGGVVGSSILGGIGANKAAKTQAGGFASGANQAEQALGAGYNDAMAYLSPYAQFGEQVLPYLQQYMQQSQERPDFSYEDFFNSQQYKDLSGQAEAAALRGASATGGLRSGNSNVAIASIAPQLAMQERQYQTGLNQYNDQLAQQRFGNLFNLAQFGGGFAQSAAQLGSNRGQQLADYRYNAATGGANARAQGQNAMFQGLGQVVGDLGSIYAGNKMGLFEPQQQAQIDMSTYQAPTYFTTKYGP